MNRKIKFIILLTSMSVLLVTVFAVAIQAQDTPEYVGTRECLSCHRSLGRDYNASVHARTTQEIRLGTVVLGDFDQGEDIRTIQFPGEDEPRPFMDKDIAFLVGTGNAVQRYAYEVEDGTYTVLPILWNVEEQAWQTSESHEWSECADCHTTQSDLGVQCEACHGAGSTHATLADEAGDELDDDERANIIGSIAIGADAMQCINCHSADAKPDNAIHQSAQQAIYEGLPIIEGIEGTPSQHFTAETPATCMTCHFGQSHTFEPVTAPPDTCVACHDDLSADYLQGFIADAQTKTSERLTAINETVTNESPDWVSQVVQTVESDGSMGIHNVAYVNTLLNSVEIELGLSAGQPQQMPVESPATCLECHTEEHQMWQQSPHANASLSDNFLHEYTTVGRPAYCMSCHASGYDPATGTYQFEGVVCSSCHTIDPTSEHPPSPIGVATDSYVCGTCHSGAHAPTYDEWLVSDHSRAGVDCVDCHTPHNNGLLLGDVNTTCGDCHQDALVDDVHMGQDLTCVECHMVKVDGEDSLQTGHTMQIPSSVCAACHGNTHSLTVAEANRSQEEIDLIAELHSEIEMLEEAKESERNTGIIGGSLGALIVVFVLFLMWRLRSLL